MSEDGSNSDRPSLAPPPLGPRELKSQLLGQLVDEVGVLESLLAALARGETTAEMFRSLHEAAVRDGRVEALGAAYERVQREHRLRRLGREHQAVFLLEAARFFADFAGDPAAAIGCAERALAAAPGSDAPLDLADRVLGATDAAARAVEMYGVAASRRSDGADLWRRCLRLVESMPGASEPALAVRERIVKLDPADALNRGELSRAYAAQGRHRDLAKLLEGVLARVPGPSQDDATNLRVRLVLLYRDALREPQRAVPHIEGLLRSDPVSEQALEMAENLMESRLLGHRLAPLLADAYARLRRPHDELSVLGRELKLSRPPRLAQVQRRLALLRVDVLDDIEGALELLGPLVASNPGDDEARRRYLEISARAGSSAEAARTLSGALHHTKDEAVRARVGYDLGTLHLALGDTASAQAAFEQVTRAGGREDAVLASARRLVELLGPSGDPKKLSRALQAVADLEPDPLRRHDAARRLAELSEKYKLGTAYAIVAWRALVDSPDGPQALSRLEQLCEGTGDQTMLAEVLELQARRAPDRERARALDLRSAEIKTQVAEPTVALQAWRSFVDRYGPSRDVHARMARLLERSGQWEELALVLEADARLAEPQEQAGVWAKLARVRLERLGDGAGALRALRPALALDPAEPTSRAAVERLLRHGPLRLEAGEVLEPIYRAEGEGATLRLVELLEARAGLVTDPAAQLGCLAEAAELAEAKLDDAARGIEICRRALRIAAVADRRVLPAWLERLQRLTAMAARPDRMAEILLEVLGDSDKLEPELAEFALVVAEALVASGSTERARSLLERALAEDPTSPELLGRIDAISAQGGSSPSERVARYERALGLVEAPDRWRQLMHAIANIEARELGAPAAAAATLGSVVGRHLDDWATHLGLVDVYETLGDTAALDAELERALGRFEGHERQRTLVRMIERLDRRGEIQRALELCRRLLDEAELLDAALDAAEQMFDKAGDADNLRRVLERRASAAKEPADRADALERLGDFFLERLGDSAQAAELWRAGARLCREHPAELECARRLCERVLDAFPSDQEAAGRLVEIYAAAGQWAKVPEVYAVCIRVETSDAERVEVLLRLAPRAAKAGAADEFIALADEALWRAGPQISGLGRKILAAKAQVLAASPSRQSDAGHAFRTLVDSYGEEEDVQEFIGFIDTTEDDGERRECLRWVYRWRAARAPDAQPILFEWAAVEETRLGDVEAAISVYASIVASDAGSRAALEALARLHLQGGRVDEALEALEGLRDVCSPSECAELDQRMAQLAIERLGRPTDALKYLSRVFERASAAAERPEATRLLRWLLETTAHASELGEARRRWCERLLGLVADDDQEALSVALSAAIEFPDGASFWSRCEEISQRIGAAPSVGTAYQRALAQPLEPATAERVGARAADFFEQVLGDPASAAASLGRVLAIAPKARWALDRVKLTLTLQRRYEELLELYDRAINAEEEPASRAELLDEAVVVARDLASDPDLATGYLEQLAELRPSDARVEATLERLYERRGQTRKLIDLVQKRMEGLPESERAAARARIAGLWVELHDAGQALATIEPVLQERNETPATLDLLEKILKLSGLPEEQQNDSLRRAQRRAREHLMGAYTRMGRAADVVRIAELGLDLFDDPADKVSSLRQIVSLCLESLGDEGRAFEALCALVRLEPDASAHRVQASALASRLSRQDRLAEVLTHAAEEADPPRIALLVEAARLYAEELGDPDRARELYLGALDRPEHDRATAREAGHALERLLSAEGRASERCTVLEHLAGLVEEPEERRAVLVEAARVAFEELSDPDRAARSWRALLEQSPGDRAAQGGLIQALRAAGRPKELVLALEARAGASTDPHAVRRDRVRIAHLYAEELGDPRAAAAAWRSIRAQFGPRRAELRCALPLV